MRSTEWIRWLAGVLAVTLALRADPGTGQAPGGSSPTKPAARSEGKAATPARKVDPAEQKYWQAVIGFRSKEPDKLAQARKLLNAAASDELTHAQLLLGECYQTGSYGYPKDLRKAVKYIRLAAERGNGFAKVSYAICLHSGIGVRANDDKAFKWATAAMAPDADYSRPIPPDDFYETPNRQKSTASDVAETEQTDPVDDAKARAHYLLALIETYRSHAAEAQAHLVAAATAGAAGRSGIREAALLAAVNYAFGRGVPRDLAKANEMVQQAGHLVRRSGLSLIHNYSAANLIDDFAVSDLEEKTAQIGDRVADAIQLKFGWGFLDRSSKDYNPAEAVKWFELAAENGDAGAMFELAMLWTGQELGKSDPAKAFSWFRRIGEGDRPKLLIGAADLAICYHEGLGTPKDPGRAAEIAKKFRGKDMVCYLISIDRCPTSLVTENDELELNETWAKKNDPQAQFLLGRRYRDGDGVVLNLKTAAEWFEKAVNAGNVAACCDLGYLYETRYSRLGCDEWQGWTKALEFYQRGAKLGDALATLHVAYMNAVGHGVPADQNKAVDLYLKSLTLDPTLTASLNNLGAIYESRWRAAITAHDQAAADKNRALTLDAYTRAEALDSSDAASNLGRLYYNGSLGSPDYQKAYGYYEKAAEHGDADARYRLGYMHEYGQGVPVTPEEAAYHYRLAALDGHLEALRALVRFYIAGNGVAVDFDRASFWLEQLVKHGDLGPLALMGEVEMRRHNYERAVKLFEPLANLSDARFSGLACTRLYECYENGWGVTKDHVFAEMFLDRAISRGDPDAYCAQARRLIAAGQTALGIDWYTKAAPAAPQAACALGQMNYFGQFMPKNVPKALEYFRQAAAGGNIEAQYFLAALAYNRVPGAPGLDEAITLAESAEKSGLAKASELREKLERRRQQESAKPRETTGERTT